MKARQVFLFSELFITNPFQFRSWKVKHVFVNIIFIWSTLELQLIKHVMISLPQGESRLCSKVWKKTHAYSQGNLTWRIICENYEKTGERENYL
jgi:hypothetical protein